MDPAKSRGYWRLGRASVLAAIIAVFVVGYLTGWGLRTTRESRVNSGNSKYRRGYADETKEEFHQQFLKGVDRTELEQTLRWTFLRLDKGEQFCYDRMTLRVLCGRLQLAKTVNHSPLRLLNSTALDRNDPQGKGARYCIAFKRNTHIAVPHKWQKVVEPCICHPLKVRHNSVPQQGSKLGKNSVACPVCRLCLLVV